MIDLLEAPAVRKFKKFINDDNKVNNIIYPLLLLKVFKIKIDFFYGEKVTYQNQ